jgi:hypothetical protein
MRPLTHHTPAARRLAARRVRLSGAMVALVVAAHVARAQVVPGNAATIGTPAADRARIAQARGTVATDSVLPAPAPDSMGGWHHRLVRPLLQLSWNSELPAGGNDAGLWSGRGANVYATGGVSLARHTSAGRLEVVISPSATYSQNRPFPVIAGRVPDRSAFSSPWHLEHDGADLPLRFGDLPLRSLGLGQSSITLATPEFAAGVSTTNEWWGSALRNTLLLGNNASGVPRLFIRTAHPVATRFGTFEGRVILGALSESPFFDYATDNDTRSLSGALVTFHPAIDTGLTLGVARLVMAPVSSQPEVLGHLADVLLRVEPIKTFDPAEPDAPRQGVDQLFSFFGRWVFPGSGFETYGELAWMELPRDLRAAFAEPGHSSGYTLGLQWSDPRPASGFLRLQAEATYLEQTQLAGRPVPDFYTGRAAIQGFTQRGQLLGAAVGPGGSSQFVAGDWVRTNWAAGAFVERTRTENDALYRQLGHNAVQHDVALRVGLRGHARLPGNDVSVELATGSRLNYLFQNRGLLGQPDAMDIRNVSLQLQIAPR